MGQSPAKVQRPTKLSMRFDTVSDVAGSVFASRDLVLLAVPRKKSFVSITSFVTDFQTSDMYALVVATHVCSSKYGNDDGSVVAKCCTGSRLLHYHANASSWRLIVSAASAAEQCHCSRLVHYHAMPPLCSLSCSNALCCSLHYHAMPPPGGILSC